jgi:L-2-hydroxyglutarate oxidase LhgO
MNHEADVVVVGAGVVGLAAAAALARAHRGVVVLERHDRIASEGSSRNSEVIHAGIYYPEGTLKARMCVEGRERLYQHCENRGVPHRQLGKIIVATCEEEVGVLEELRERGLANGAPDLEMLSAEEVRRREPALRAAAGLFSPRTGIVDAHALCLSYAAEAESHGAQIALRTRVVEIDPIAGGFRVTAVGDDGEASAVTCAVVVNATGLCGDALAELVGIDVDERGYRLHPCKGDYFSLAPGAPLRVTRLVYPVHTAAGLGVHATLDLGGRIRFGPDATYVDSVHYRVEAEKAGSFAEAVRRYLPGIQTEWLSPDYAGVRPKLAGPDEGFRDFVIAEESEAGLPGFVNLIGIESPGLTAAGAIAERVVELLRGL